MKIRGAFEKFIKNGIDTPAVLLSLTPFSCLHEGFASFSFLPPSSFLFGLKNEKRNERRAPPAPMIAYSWGEIQLATRENAHQVQYPRRRPDYDGDPACVKVATRRPIYTRRLRCPGLRLRSLYSRTSSLWVKITASSFASRIFTFFLFREFWEIMWVQNSDFSRIGHQPILCRTIFFALFRQL